MSLSRIILPAALFAAASMMFVHDSAASNIEGAEKPGTLSFAKLDMNQDGQLARTELPKSSMYHKHFAAIDADGDGMLSETEVHDHLLAMGIPPERMKGMDHGDMQGMEHDSGSDKDRDGY